MEALVLAATRKAITVLLGEQVLAAVHSIRKSEIVVGDRVKLRQEQSGLFVDQILERDNLLYRSYQGRSKRLAANLDQLLVVAATGALFNTVTVDRALIAAACAGIETTLVINKIDLASQPDFEKIEVYKSIGLEVVTTNAKSSQSLTRLRTLLSNPKLRSIAFTGISGVGKSTLLNTLVPSAQLRTAEVSDRSGQGTQTTSLAHGFVYKRAGLTDAVLFDLPGIQFFGVSHLSAQEIARAYPEFSCRADSCKFADCMHRSEPDCLVRAALERGEIAQFRYQSYLSMLDEVAKVPAY